MTQVVQIIELVQRRCSLRFGVSPCTATGTPKCFQTFATCGDQANYNRDGVLRWFFHRPGDPAPNTAAAASANDISGPSIPILGGVSTEESRINLGAIREGESPFGLRGTISIDLDDFEFRNQFGDFYASERQVKGSLAALLLSWLGEAAPQLELYWYQGVKGQALGDMTKRRFEIINIDPPSGGRWRIEGMDPLHRALRTKAQFPRPTDIRLVGDIDDTTTSITVFGTEADVSNAFGNTSERYARIGSEIISYASYSASGSNWALSGVVRGALGTERASHSANDGIQRVGHYVNMRYWEIVNDLLQNHTTIAADLIPFSTQWTAEGGTYLSTLRGTGSFVEPRPVEDICGIAMRDGMFSLWWDAIAQQIKIKALRQPREAPRVWNERQHLLDVALVREPDQRLTRVVTYYGRGNPTIRLDEATNYATQRARVDAGLEDADYADGTVRARIVYSPLLRTDANAVLTQALQLQRYGQTPVYLSMRVARKDATAGIGDVVQVETTKFIDRLGNPLVTSWEIIQGPREVEPGLVYEYMAQSFVLFPRASFIMANDAPDFASATDAQKQNACYMSENTGLMPDGSVAYVIQ